MNNGPKTPPHTQKYLRACAEIIAAMLGEGEFAPSAFVIEGTCGHAINKQEICRLIKART